MTHPISGHGVRRAAGLLTAVAVLGLLPALTPPAVHGEETSMPSAVELSLQRIIRTNPFAGSKVAMRDQEGSTYVPRDGSIWLADDSGRQLMEVDAATGALKRVVGPAVLESARAVAGSRRAGSVHTGDLEGLAYDRARDVLFAFSGSCCDPTVRPAVFRLVRKTGRLRVESFRALPEGSDNTAAAWHRGRKRLFVSGGDTIRPYSYSRNRYGRATRVPGLNRILGMEFSPNGELLHVVHAGTSLSRVGWPERSLISTVDLDEHGVGDARAVAPVRGRLFVSDGDTTRERDDPRRLAVLVFGR